MRAGGALLCAVLLGVLPAAAGDDGPHPERLRGVDAADLAYTYGAGGFTPEYELPAPGSYTLPVIDTLEDHRVLDVHGRPTVVQLPKAELERRFGRA